MSSTDKYALKRKSSNFKLESGNLVYYKEDKKYIFVGDFEADKVKAICDVLHLPGHIGKNILRHEISKKYVGISTLSIYSYVDSCINCQRETIPNIVAPLQPIVPSYVRERIIIDTIDLSEYEASNRGYKYVFTMIDSFSKFAFCFPARRKNAENFLKSFKKLYFSEGKWKIVHTDNGGEFTANIVGYFFQEIGVIHIRGSPYHPQSQGQVERFNRTLKSRLRKALDENNRNWIDILNSILFQYNNLKNWDTKIKPFILLKGTDPSDENFSYRQNTFDDKL